MRQCQQVITIIIITLLSISCSKNDKEDNKVFLDFHLGMTEEEFQSKRDSLQEINELYTKEYHGQNSLYMNVDLKSYFYDLKVITEESIITLEVEEEIENGRLIEITLNMVCFPTRQDDEMSGFWKSYLGFYKISTPFGVNYVSDMYSEKYGEPQIKLMPNEDYVDDFKTHSWQKGNINVIMSFGKKDMEYNVIHNAKITYEFTDEYKETYEEQLAKEVLGKI